MGMKIAIGIDLGSTTSKAVMLDEERRIIGRGITNSRSNYDVASAVARGEAEVDARMSLLRRAVDERAESFSEPGRVTKAVERAFRETQVREGLTHLREAALQNAALDAYSRWHGSIEGVLAEVFDAMEADVAPRYREESDNEQLFFRDLASSGFTEHAGDRADRRVLPFEVLMGIFDKSILQVEGMVLDSSFDDRFHGILAEVLGVIGATATESASVTELVRQVAAIELETVAMVGTGYGRARLPFARECIRSEILCHGLGANVMFPGTATVLDIGGQDTKAMQVDEAGLVTSFHMNDRCAAGCGRFLGYIADEMNLGLHELAPLALAAERQVKINSTCTVFAGAELRERLSIGQRREDIVAGLHRAIILRALSLLARAGGVRPEFTFTGGVARNEAAVKSLAELVMENYQIDRINISPDSIYTGALGAAHFAWRSNEHDDAEKEVAA